ncbi:HpcH/HpaI aldolase/citrate lyase family protein [Paraburkholderia sp. HP33-1]|uniref:HpcH/HpaI aldolase/citrate lyase family protein n=1 Tax=Paraburkholderia sp. HP33-1 TaxID=2883243 RepID=UPI001F1CF5FE|nr:CoA ester lyase [Paraburkholderia sp. HP33-1]
MRSFLFVPGSKPERFVKALAAGADAVIVDLEDAVADADKASARAHVADAARTFSASPVRVLLRINGAATQWFEEDLSLAALDGIDGVVLPKAENPAALTSVAAVTTKSIWPIIESAQGVWNALDVARMSGVERLIFGSVDFELDLDCDGSRDALLHARSRIVLASRVAGIQSPVDGITVSIDDERQVAEDSSKARSLGFGGKLCIHPRQVKAVNAAFTPSADEIANARRIVEAYEKAEGGVVSVDGRMVDLPVLVKARRIVSLFENVRGAVEG